MPAPKPKVKLATKGASISAPEKWPFGKKNYYWFGAALVTMIIGFVLLGTGSITLAPLLLVIAYCVLVPVAILVKDEPKSDTGGPSEPIA
ncbi:MAG: hypothetical protein WAU88_11745 [Candidatus Zixiibacteriota bacterium]